MPNSLIILANWAAGVRIELYTICTQKASTPMNLEFYTQYYYLALYDCSAAWTSEHCKRASCKLAHVSQKHHRKQMVNFRFHVHNMIWNGGCSRAHSSLTQSRERRRWNKSLDVVRCGCADVNHVNV